MRIKIKRLREDAAIPLYAHIGDSGADLVAVENIELEPLQYASVPTGISVEIPLGFEMQIRPKSGIALNYGVTVLNAPGTIDSGYRGEIKVILINLGSNSFQINKGDKIAQLVLTPVVQAVFHETGVLSDSERGEGGFGSTGTNTTN